MAFIIVCTLVFMVAGVLMLSTVSVRNIHTRTDQQRAFYIAEAGFNKALWYLATDPVDGGEGLEWRTSGRTESCAGGSYTIKVEDDPSLMMLVTSSGSFEEASHTIQALVYAKFDEIFTKYTIFSQKDFEMLERSQAKGDTFADGDFTIKALAKIYGGKVFVTSGHVATGEGEYVQGDLLEMPEVPSVNTYYYDQKIATALAGGPEVIKGNPIYGDKDLNGLPLYVDGNVTLTGNLTGAGEIITTGNIIIKPTANVDERIMLIANGNINLETQSSTDPTLGQEVVLFAKNNITTQSNFQNEEPISLICDGNLTLGNDNQIYGLMSGGKIAIGKDCLLEGSLICGTATLKHVLDTDAVILYREPAFTPPLGVPTQLVVYKYLQY